jgi:hypothetical protein
MAQHRVELAEAEQVANLMFHQDKMELQILAVVAEAVNQQLMLQEMADLELL